MCDEIYRVLSDDVAASTDWSIDWRIKIGILHALIQEGKNLSAAEAMCESFLVYLKKCGVIDKEAELNGQYTLAVLRTKQKQWYKAETILTHCYTSSREIMGPHHQLTLQIMSSLGECKLYIGEYDIAELLLEDCMKAQKEFLGEKHIDSLATAYRLGCYYYDLGQYAKAEGCFNQCFLNLRDVHGGNDPAVLPALMKLGCVYNIERKFKLAEETFRQYLTLCKDLNVTEQPDYLMALQTLANILYVQWDYESALPYWKEINAIYKARDGENSVGYLEALNSLALVYLRMLRYADAEAAFLTCLTHGTQLLGPSHPLVNTWRGNYESAITEAEESRRSQANSRASSRASSRGSRSRKGSRDKSSSGVAIGDGAAVEGDVVVPAATAASGLQKSPSVSDLRPDSTNPKQAVDESGSTTCTIF
eukprot:gene26087-31502_t